MTRQGNKPEEVLKLASQSDEQLTILRRAIGSTLINVINLQHGMQLQTLKQMRGSGLFQRVFGSRTTELTLTLGDKYDYTQISPEVISPVFGKEADYPTGWQVRLAPKYPKLVAQSSGQNEEGSSVKTWRHNFQIFQAAGDDNHEPIIWYSLNPQTLFTQLRSFERPQAIKTSGVAKGSAAPAYKSDYSLIDAIRAKLNDSTIRLAEERTVESAKTWGSLQLDHLASTFELSAVLHCKALTAAALQEFKFPTHL